MDLLTAEARRQADGTIDRARHRLPLAKEAAGDWLRARAEDYGFRLNALALDGYRVESFARRGRAFGTLGIFDLKGTLRITSPEAFLSAFGRASGAAKRSGAVYCSYAGSSNGHPARNARCPPTQAHSPKRSHVDRLRGAGAARCDGRRIRARRRSRCAYAHSGGGLGCIMLEPGARISHAAVALAARVGTLLLWVGEAGVRLYAAGQPGGARADRLLWQCRLALDPNARLKIVRRMFQVRFGEKAPDRRSVDQLRGIEGVRVRIVYQGLAQQFGVHWQKRRYDPWPGMCLMCQIVVCRLPLPACTASRKPLSWRPAMRRRLASCTRVSRFRSSTTSPTSLNSTPWCRKRSASLDCMRVTASVVAIRCGKCGWRAATRSRRTHLLRRLIPAIEDVLSAGELSPPVAPADAVHPAFPDQPASGDTGHRP